MGIPGIYKEIGSGERIALSKLAVRHLEETGRPLRVAIDISIWQFQIRSGQGGQNPALRTLYYRLLKLLGLSIQPLFIFDGPYRPPFKRGAKVTPHCAHLDNFLTKHLLKLFGFPFHDAPGEAEAECALLQRDGIVDAVFSEDVDTLMFGAGLTLRNWTAEGSRGNKTPTHINVYRLDKIKEASGLDSEGMILVALMSGGDYIQAGLANCGPKIACQAARAGFGHDLCQIHRKDETALREWRQRLRHELMSNESNFFQRKNKAVQIPESFPDQTVLGYYMKPTVSSTDKMRTLRVSIQWGNPIDIPGLRTFVAEAFSWTYRIGAVQFIRGLAPTLLAAKLIVRSTSEIADRQSMDTKAMAESELVKSISKRRIHWMTDGEPELNLAYVPADIVGLDLDTEEDVQRDLGDQEEDETSDDRSGSEVRERSVSPTKRAPLYDPTKVDKIWMLETFVKLGAPLLVETWEEDMRDPKKFATRKARERKNLGKPQPDMPQGSLDQFVKISKPGINPPAEKTVKSLTALDSALPTFKLPQSQALRVLEENLRRVGEKNDRGIPVVGKKKTKSKSAETEKANKPSTNDVSNPLDLTQSSPIPEKPSRDTSSAADVDRDPSTDFVTQRSPTRQKKHNRSNSSSSPQRQESQTAATRCPLSRQPSITDASISSQPSPRKKRTSLQRLNELFLTGQLKTPESTPRHQKLQSSIDDYLSQKPAPPPSPSRANRKLTFDAPTVTRKTRVGQIDILSDSDSDSDALPSPSALLSPPLTQQETPESPIPSKPQQAVETKGRNQGNVSECMVQQHAALKKMKSSVIVRESLEGAWKCLDPWEVDKDKARKVFSDVDVVDLT